MESAPVSWKLVLLSACCLGCASLTEYARADTTFNVNTAADEIDPDPADGVCLTSTGHCSLRAAVMQANHLSAPGTAHIFLQADNYILTRPSTGMGREDNGDLNFTTSLAAGQQVIAIHGTSAASSVIDANQIDRVISIEQNCIVTISNVTIRRGYRISNDGGGIDLAGKLTMQDSVVADNFSVSGGGIFVEFVGHLFVLRSKFQSNQASSYGGSVAVEGEASFRDTSMNGNFAGLGGAAYVEGRATFREATLSGNHSTAGGAIFVYSAAAILNVINSTISGNTVTGDGGGIFSNFGESYFVNSTISGNTANRDGGGIKNQGTTWLYNTSIINNDASHDRNPPGGNGGGIYNLPGKRLVVTNSLIEDNTTLDSPILDDCNGVLEVYGWNLLADYTGCSFSGNGNAARGLVSPNTIGPLANNGGPTLTHALLGGSEAIDTTTAQGCIDPTSALLVSDQRGALRIAGSKCDVGAYEYDSVFLPGDVIFSHGFELYVPAIE